MTPTEFATDAKLGEDVTIYRRHPGDPEEIISGALSGIRETVERIDIRALGETGPRWAQGERRIYVTLRPWNVEILLVGWDTLVVTN